MPWEKSLLLVAESKPGKEKLVAKLIKGPELGQLDFGNAGPVTGATVYDVCIYNEAGDVAGKMRVDRAASQCAGRDCWKRVGTKGFLYKDKDNSADGISLMKMLGGTAGKSKILIKGKNNSNNGQAALPTGMATALAGSNSARLQLHSSDGGPRCYETTVDSIIKNDATFFKAE
jgi:hypothetical protein